MRITNIRIKGQKTELLPTLVAQLEYRFAKAGFITDVSIVNSQAIKIGLWMRSFKLDTAKHARNLQVNPYGNKLTTLPTWDQRVQFNNIVNAVLNKWKVSANVKSGPFIIRKGKECFGEYEWNDQVPMWMQENERRGWYITEVDEKRFIEQRNLERRLKARARRAAAIA